MGVALCVGALEACLGCRMHAELRDGRRRLAGCCCVYEGHAQFSVWAIACVV
jgi:hypothetical protein